MKKRTLLMALALSVTLFALSCEEDNTKNEVFSVETKSLNFKPEGETLEIIIKSENVTWNVSKKTDWMTTEADTKAGKVKVTVAKNDSGSIREGVITIGCPGFNSVDVSVKQAYTANPAGKTISCDVKELNFGADGGVEKVTVTAVDVEWTFEADEWLKVERKDNVLNVTTQPFIGNEARNGKITIKAQGLDDIVVTVKQTAKNLTVDQTGFFLSGDGEQRTIAVGAVNTKWNAESSDGSWLTIEVKEKSIEIKATANTTGDERTGTITVAAKDFKDIVINVRQAIGEDKVLWNRSIGSLMNLHSKIKSVSYYYDFAAQKNNAIWDLQFAEDGTLTSFYNNEDEGGLPVKYELTYDEQKRLTQVKIDAETLKAVLVFKYSDHNFYMPLEEIFYAMSPRIKVANYSWIPRFLKGLESVTYFDGERYDNITYTVTGNKAVGNYNEDEVPQFHIVNFENGYPKTFEYSLFGKKRRDYAMDTETGMIKTVEGYSMVGGSLTKTLTYVYNQDRINSLSKLERDAMPLNYTYDDNLNMVSYIDKEGVEHKVVYEYDSRGNWISMQIDGGEKVSREIVYY